MRGRILLVEDDALTARGVAFALRDEGFDVDTAENGKNALARARERPPDLVVLDVRLPGGLSGMDVCRQLRSESAVPILIVTARDTEADTVLALERGADDYLTKPFSLAELVARVRALLRGRVLARGGLPTVREIGELRLDLVRHEVTLEGVPVHTTPSEFRLLSMLAERPDQAVSRRDLCVGLWGTDRSLDTRACDLHVARLRRKIEVDASRPRRLVTVRSVGYKLVASDGRSRSAA